MFSTPTSRERILAALCACLVGMFLFGGPPLGTAKDNFDRDILKELKIFTDVISIIQRDYVHEVGSDKLVEGAIKGMLTALDPHSGYLDPEFYQDLQVQTKGEFGGLGIEITIKDGLLVVVAPMEGSPAEKSGIIAGDAIVKIEGKFTKEFSLVDAVKKLRGPKGSPITISVARQGQQKLIDVTIVRDNILVDSVKARSLGDGYAYARLSQFMEKTADDLESSLTKITKESPNGALRGLILDMRNNPGGLLTQAIRVSDMFLEEGVVVYTEGRVESQKQKFFAHARDTQPNYPIVVLINGGSASASEIVAGALKDHGRALILGTQTFGKGSVQTITPLENGGALTLTTALYFTKSGQSIQAKGVSPDIEVEAPVPTPKVEAEEEPTRSQKMRESDLPGAIKNPGEHEEGATPLHKINKTPTISSVPVIDPATVKISEWVQNDPQFARALEVIKSFGAFSTPKEILQRQQVKAGR